MFNFEPNPSCSICCEYSFINEICMPRYQNPPESSRFPKMKEILPTTERISNMTMWLEVTRIFDFITFVMSTFINGVLLNLIKTASPKHFGNYVYLMMSFSVNSLIFAVIHAFLQPIISTEKYVLFVFTSTNYLEVPRGFMRVLLSVYGTSYSQALVLIAVQFIYRCFSISRRKFLIYFKGRWLFFWYALVGVFGINWGLCIFFIAQENPQVDEILRPLMASSFGLNMSDVFYVAASYEVEDEFKNKVLNWPVIFMIINFASIMGLSFAIIVLCFCFIHYKMQRVTHSKVYEAVQQQLFRALMSQMIIPLVLIYLPIIIVMILPIFHLKNDACMSLTSILISIYPVLDPFAVIMIISVYRQGFLNMFTNHPKTNQISNLEMST
ncbi:CRE-STR-78 protein [Caenorhabditis remanei]|uniref:CRE-STR-78 protein n=1 Tax=Caenorhabditis remanei TaxID=31234 RepID=E3MH15_CAERE|nr:CRE-STR-78 protein [Caenorhabditis remanei]